MGGLTFDSAKPSKFLKIPNLIAAQRFGFALINQYGLYHTMQNALYVRADSGNLMDVLSGYCHLMQQRDIGRDAFTKTEEHHQDSILITILENPAIQPMVKSEVRKVRSLLIYYTSQHKADLNNSLQREKDLLI
jgi:hypothetical protein